MTTDHSSVTELEDILLGTENLEEFLSGLCGFAAGIMGQATGQEIEVAATLKRSRRVRTIAGSSARAVELDHIEQGVGKGPCIEALQTMQPMALTGAKDDERWPTYQAELVNAGISSTVGVPLSIGDDAAACLNFFAPEEYAFVNDAYERALGFGEVASRSMRLAVRITAAEDRNQDLTTAMKSRTAIDLAAGVIMGQNRCSQEEAMRILTSVSSTRNQKLRDVATEMLTNISGGAGINTHFTE